MSGNRSIQARIVASVDSDEFLSTNIDRINSQWVYEGAGHDDRFSMTVTGHLELTENSEYVFGAAIAGGNSFTPTLGVCFTQMIILNL